MRRAPTLAAILLLLATVYVVTWWLNGETGSPISLIPPEDQTVYQNIVVGAREEVERGVTYDAAYMAMAYPGGDVPPGRGACTDVIIRALRRAGYDLQELIFEDMSLDSRAYPQLWGHRGPDPNIDHRRIPNQMTFLLRHGTALPLGLAGDDLPTWQPGDLVYWEFPGGSHHCEVITDRVGRSGMPMVIHNADVAREQDCLNRWKIIGHYRFPPP